MATIRSFRDTDLPAIFDVCVKTGHAGKDATGIYPDPDLLPNIFAAPFLAAEPELGFVAADDDGQAVGYVLGTADAVGYAAWFRSTWLPVMALRYPKREAPLKSWDDVMVKVLHDPDHIVKAELADYPAVVHINLLPAFQGQGLGRGLMDSFLGALSDRDVPAVHLATASVNTGGRAFYEKMGFRELDITEPGLTYLGRSTKQV
jgi:ribosomal protein S18 acetylase RimI-like enzyme